jgi:hypothetical protein
MVVLTDQVYYGRVPGTTHTSGDTARPFEGPS